MGVNARDQPEAIMSNALVPVSRANKIALKAAPIEEVAEQLLGEIPLEAAPTDFPDLPAAITASKEIKDALVSLRKFFNETSVSDRRTLTEDETESLGQEYAAIQKVLKLIEKRETQIKEIIRTHQDVEAEEQGKAFPRDVVRNGNIIAKATDRDKNGHYILAAPKEPQVTKIPGMTESFANQFVTGKLVKDFGAIDRAYAAGEIDDETYRAVTVTKRVPDPDRIRAYVLKTGDAAILSMIIKRGLNSSAMYLRSLRKN